MEDAEHAEVGEAPRAAPSQDQADPGALRRFLGVDATGREQTAAGDEEDDGEPSTGAGTGASSLAKSCRPPSSRNGTQNRQPPRRASQRKSPSIR
mgnify:CR=1 FL=1